MNGWNRLLGIAAMGLLVASLPLTALAQVPGQIPIQGYLTDADGVPYDSEVAINFVLYDAATGGTELFRERQTIIVDRGVFSAYLGMVEMLDLGIFRDNGRVFLGVQMGADAEASPRLAFAAVPWAAYADDAANFGGVAASELPTTVEEWAREACLDTEEELTALLDDNYGNPAWGSITGIPADIADGDDGFTTEEELTALLDDNYGNPAWDSLTGVPAGFADGTDDGFTTEEELTDLLDDNYRAAGWVPNWSDILGIPAGFADGTDDMVTAGAGLSLDGDTLSVDFDGPGEADTAARSDALEDIEERLAELESSAARRRTGAVYYWNVFDTYQDGQGWVMDNDASLFGGVHPSWWTDSDYYAYQMSSNMEVIRTMFTHLGVGGANALVWSERYHMYSSTNGKVVAVLFRIRNTTDHAITWTPYFRYTSYAGWNERASVSLNRANSWNSGGNNCGPGNCTASVSLSIPADSTNTVVFISPSDAPWHWYNNVYVRYVGLAFYNNSLRLPAGLEYVEDLDTAEAWSE